MLTQILDAKRKLTDTELANAERQLGATLPTEYKDFLLAHNGGYPDPGSFSFDDGKEEGHISWFLAIHDGEISNLLLTAEIIKGRIPKDMLAIAYDDFGNWILLGMSGPRLGKIFFWDHDQEEANAGADLEAPMRFIADSLDALLKSLR